MSETQDLPKIDKIVNEKVRPDPDLPLAISGAVRIRWCSRLAAAAIALVCVALGGESWLEWLFGAILGGLVVEINLGFLIRLLVKSPSWKGRSLWPSIFGFYLTFGATILACFLVVRNHWGNPLAFLFGLLSFFLGLVFGLLSMIIKKPKVSADV